jgi:large subunit ribosomal protein L4
MVIEEPILAFQKPLLAWIRQLGTGTPLRQRSLCERPFGVPLRPDLIQRVVVWYRAGLRAGTASTKDRSQVMGSTRKLRPNNNMGKARVGSIRSPIRRGGGVCHGPKPKDWAFPIPDPVLRHAMMSSLAAKYAQSELLLVPNDTLAFLSQSPSERDLLKLLSKTPLLFADKKKLLFIDTWPIPDNFREATKDLSSVYYATVQDDLNAYHILNNDLLILTERTVSYFEKLFLPPPAFRPVNAISSLASTHQASVPIR